MAIVNNAAIMMYVSFLIRVLAFEGYMPRSGIAGSHGNSIFSFLLRRGGQNTQKNCTKKIFTTQIIMM